MKSLGGPSSFMQFLLPGTVSPELNSSPGCVARGFGMPPARRNRSFCFAIRRPTNSVSTRRGVPRRCSPFSGRSDLFLRCRARSDSATCSSFGARCLPCSVQSVSSSRLRGFALTPRFMTPTRRFTKFIGRSETRSSVTRRPRRGSSRGMPHEDCDPPAESYDAGVVQERHYALNWLIGYCGQDWDNITTDT